MALIISKSMKLIIKVLLLIFPFFIINILYQNSDEWKNKYDLERFKSIPEGIEVANLGSSHGSAFDYNIGEFEGLNCFNFAIPQQTLDFDYAVLRQNINNFKKDSILMILVSPFETDGIPDYEFNRDAKLRYYGFLKHKYFEDFSIHDWLTFNCLAIFLSPHPLADIKKLFTGPKVSPNNRKDEVSLHFLDNSISLQDTKEKRFDDLSPEEKQTQIKVYITEGWLILFPPSQVGKTYNKKYISSMIDLCKVHEINPVIITTPISKEAFDVLYNGSTTTYYNIYKFHEELKQEYPEVKFLNYIDLYFNESHYFEDNNHLTRTGAKDFSRRVYSDLSTLKYIKKK